MYHERTRRRSHYSCVQLCEDDFFPPIKQCSAQGLALGNSKQIESYLTCTTNNMDILKSFLTVCNLALKLNTSLHASAACERLFSTVELIFRPRRSRLDSKNSERHLLLRLNNRFW